METICLWPEGTWCTISELDEYLIFMSDDFCKVKLTHDEYMALLEGNENILLPYLR